MSISASAAGSDWRFARRESLTGIAQIRFVAACLVADLLRGLVCAFESSILLDVALRWVGTEFGHFGGGG